MFQTTSSKDVLLRSSLDCDVEDIDRGKRCRDESMSMDYVFHRNILFQTNLVAQSSGLVQLWKSGKTPFFK